MLKEEVAKLKEENMKLMVESMALKGEIPSHVGGGFGRVPERPHRGLEPTMSCNTVGRFNVYAIRAAPRLTSSLLEMP